MKINNMKSNPIKILQLKKGIHWKDYIDISKYGNMEYDCISYHSLSYNPHGSKNVQYKKI